MATRMLRRGLPRVPGGDPWPPADAVAEDATVDDRAADAVTSAAPDEPATIPEVAVSSDVEVPVDVPVRATGPMAVVNLSPGRFCSPVRRQPPPGNCPRSRYALPTRVACGKASRWHCFAPGGRERTI